MEVTYDPEADAIYVQLREPAPDDRVWTKDLEGHRLVNLDQAGNVIGIEFLVVSQGIDLTDVPEAERVAALLRAIPHPTPA